MRVSTVWVCIDKKYLSQQMLGWVGGYQISFFFFSGGVTRDSQFLWRFFERFELQNIDEVLVWHHLQYVWSKEVWHISQTTMFHSYFCWKIMWKYFIRRIIEKFWLKTTKNFNTRPKFGFTEKFLTWKLKNGR